MNELKTKMQQKKTNRKDGILYLKNKLIIFFKLKDKFIKMNNPQTRFGKKIPVTNDGKKIITKNLLK